MAHGVRVHPQQVRLKRKRLEAYRRLAGDDMVTAIRDLGSDLRGTRVLELSSTATGGGVAELLASLVPLQRDIGLDVQWDLIPGDPPFFDFTKALHNGLQGKPITITPENREEYVEHNAAYAESLGDGWDVVVVHDPQPAAVRELAQTNDETKWIWRCHIDSSTPDPTAADFLRPFLDEYDCVVYTLPEFVLPGLGVNAVFIKPAIDPLTSKNRELPAFLARETVEELGIDLSRPLMIQVSRFDPWKDPLGVVEVWRLARRTFPELQLALVGAMAGDDPEGWQIYEELEAAVHDEPDCFLLTNQMGVTAHEVNALQRVTDVAVQKSIREGFGLVVSETLWKGTPIVAGRAGGIPSQLEDGVSGRLASGVEEFAEAVRHLLEEPTEARQLGSAGRRRVREEFLVPRLLLDQLTLLKDILA
ncbi:MAG TPA: glycosyltransferase [Solirubrobacterales bacterium]